MFKGTKDIKVNNNDIIDNRDRKISTRNFEKNRFERFLQFNNINYDDIENRLKMLKELPDDIQHLRQLSSVKDKKLEHVTDLHKLLSLEEMSSDDKNSIKAIIGDEKFNNIKQIIQKLEKEDIKKLKLLETLHIEKLGELGILKDNSDSNCEKLLNIFNIFNNNIYEYSDKFEKNINESLLPEKIQKNYYLIHESLLRDITACHDQIMDIINERDHIKKLKSSSDMTRICLTDQLTAKADEATDRFMKTFDNLKALPEKIKKKNEGHIHRISTYEARYKEIRETFFSFDTSGRAVVQILGTTYEGTIAYEGLFGKIIEYENIFEGKHKKMLNVLNKLDGKKTEDDRTVIESRSSIEDDAVSVDTDTSEDSNTDDPSQARHYLIENFSKMERLEQNILENMEEGTAFRMNTSLKWIEEQMPNIRASSHYSGQTSRLIETYNTCSNKFKQISEKMQNNLNDYYDTIDALKNYTSVLKEACSEVESLEKVIIRRIEANRELLELFPMAENHFELRKLSGKYTEEQNNKFRIAYEEYREKSPFLKLKYDCASHNIRVGEYKKRIIDHKEGIHIFEEDTNQYNKEVDQYTRNRESFEADVRLLALAKQKERERELDNEAAHLGDKDEEFDERGGDLRDEWRDLEREKERLKAEETRLLRENGRLGTPFNLKLEKI